MATNARVPLCHFFFSHPFRVGDVCHGTLPLRHPRLPHPAPLAWRRGRARVRRRGVRRYPPPQLLKAHVFLHPPGASLVPRSPPTIEELLWTIRDAWPPPRSLSLDSEKRDKSKVQAEVMGTGKKEQPTQRMGLPYRRYSVPETVMRKYSLSRAQTSASDVVTAPTPSVPSVGTSSGAVRRMCHKACQTSPQPVVPTVNITPAHSVLSHSEEIADYAASMCPSQVYKSELSLPGAVVDSVRFLRVPELILDPHDSPQVNLDDNIIDENTTFELGNSSGVNMERDQYTETDTLDSENLSSLQYQSDTQQRKNMFRSKSNSVPETSEPTTRTNRTGSADGEHLCDEPNDAGELTIEQQLHFEQSLSPEGTPTPAPTCHTYDSQGNMLSECYITDCEVCNAEGRKCCSLDDSGSQSCSFTSPEMMSSNDLKSSTDFTTSSMTLDQTVSDRTTSTQDSTVSLTSITPESAESKDKCSNIYISPILVIDSETTLVSVSPKSKNKDDKVLAYQLGSSQSELSKSQTLSDNLPAIISCESGLVPESQSSINNVVSKDFDNKEDNKMSLTHYATREQTYSELNNNKVTLSKDTYTQVSQPLTTISEDEALQPATKEGSKCQADHYLYLTESESGNTQDSVDEGENRRNHKVVGNYTTSHLYLTETESTPTEDLKEDMYGNKQKTGAFSSNYLYMTESESSEGLKTSTTANTEEAINQKVAGNYVTNYMYITESESSGPTRSSDTNEKNHSESRKKVGGSYAKNHLYMTESESPESSKTPSSDSKKVGEPFVENYTSGAYATDYLYMTESESSEATKTLHANCEKESETIRKNVGTYTENYMYMTESDSPETHRTTSSEVEINTKLEVARAEKAMEYMTEPKTPETVQTEVNDSKSAPKSVGNFNTDYFYMTETESSDNTKKSDTFNEEELVLKRKNTGNYTSNYMYLTESESPKTNNTFSSEDGKNVEVGQTGTDNCAPNNLDIPESEVSMKSKTSIGEIKTDKECVQKPIGNSATGYLYMSESESSESKGRQKCGASTTNYLYLTESESPNDTKSSTEENIEENIRKGFGSQYATSHLYMTESDSTSETKCLPSQINDKEKSDSSGITKVSLPDSKDDISKRLAGNYSKGYLYLTESESDKTQTSTREDFGKIEIKKHHKAGGSYTTNYMYITEDESSFYPDSLDIDRGSSKEEFEMDSLAINESTDESNLLENLGFCDESSTVKCQSKATYTETIKDELTCEIPQKNFYGNIKYEIIVKDNDPTKGSFKGNVMPVLDEKLGPKVNNFSVGNIVANPGNQNQNVDLIKERDIPTDNELGSTIDDRETTMGSVAGGTYWEIPGKELVIPRFSALPRTLSMIVNTSSMDCSSDSDLSLADSLEDNKSDDKNKGIKLYNKYDNRLVRGDIIALLPEESDIPKKTSKESQAYFLSITGEEGEIKVEQIPEELKRKLLKRDKELRKHSSNSSHDNKCKGKTCSKKSKKHHHQHCCLTADHSSKSSCKTKSLDEFSDKLSKFTQWEDLGSSKDSSDTLVPSDFSERDKDTIFQGDYKLKDVSTSPRKCEFIDNDQQNDLNCWLESVNNTCAMSDAGQEEENEKNHTANNNKMDNKEIIEPKSGEIKTLKNKWVQCGNMPHVDSTVDEDIARILIENSTNNDDETADTTEKRKFKCTEHQVPWSKDMFVQVSQDELLVQDIVDADVQTSTLTESKSVQTAENIIEEVKEKKEKPASKSKSLQEETNRLELNLTGSPRNQNEKRESEIKFLNITDDDERCKTPVLGERPDSKNESSLKQEKTLYNKPSPKFNVKSTPPRRTGNLGARFKQKFEVIPEEKSGSFESSNDEKKSPRPARGRRASMPSEVIFKDLGHSQNKSSDSSTSSNDKKDSEECDHVRNIQTTGEGGDYPRRHTIHGNLTSRNTKTEASNQDKEHSRRHTIHGNLSLTKNDAMLKQLNLLGGTLLKGRVFGKQSGVMFGRFRPINEETQVQKDERSLVEEQLERLRRDASKGREALAVARTEGEQDELLTLSKGWINFYLLRDSQDLGSDGSNAEEGSKDSSRSEDRKRATPSMKTVTVVGKSEEDLRHQFTVQINASPETCPESKLPDICDPHKCYKTPSLSPDLTLPDISPTSSPASTPPPDTPLSLKPELPQINPKGSRNKRSNEKYKPNGRKPPEKTEKREKVLVDNDQNLRYMKLSSMKHELQTEKTYFARSGEVACSELSQSSSTSVTADSPTLPSIKWPSRQLQRRSHPRHLHTRAATTATHPNPQACWTVTLAGSSGNPTQPPPDVEMRLSFSNQTRGPATSQSDSGLGEDGPPERGHRGPHPHHALPPPGKHPPPDTNQWKVLLKTHQETEKSSDQVKTDKRLSLPEFNFTPSAARQKKNKPVLDREEGRGKKKRHDPALSKSKKS